LKGVGPRRAESLARMGILTARDLLYHLPRRYDDASTITPLASAEVGMEVTVVGEIGSKGVIPTRRGLRIFQVVIRDDTGALTCSWPGQPWLDRELRVGDRILVTGPVRSFHGRQIQPREHALLDRRGSGREDHDPPTHSHPRGGPDHPQRRKSHPPERQAAAPDAAPGTIFVTYPASKEVPQWVLRRILTQNLEWLLRHAAKEDAIDPRERRGLGLPRWRRGPRVARGRSSIDGVAPARRRLA
ncbi:MAG: OB-fold nucleic acid binding domain-containing protein, partial [Gemmatimonadetes bacterium]|nr:OB-fold nucleic acid binding domain-containing protein [Gemmatimonadota bacterium]